MSRADEIEQQLLVIALSMRSFGVCVNLYAISEIITRAVEQAHKQQQVSA